MGPSTAPRSARSTIFAHTARALDWRPQSWLKSVAVSNAASGPGSLVRRAVSTSSSLLRASACWDSCEFAEVGGYDVTGAMCGVQ